MPLVKILQNYQNAEGWQAGDVVDVTDPELLLKQNKVALIGSDGKIISKDESEARHFIDRLGREEAASLAFDILRKLNLLDSLIQQRPATVKKEEVKEEVKETKTEKTKTK